MWVSPDMFNIIIWDRIIYINRNNKNLPNKVIWSYTTTIYNLHSLILSKYETVIPKPYIDTMYSFELFDEEYIILGVGYRDYSWRYNTTTESKIAFEIKNIPPTTHNLIEWNASALSITKLQHKPLYYVHSTWCTS